MIDNKYRSIVQSMKSLLKSEGYIGAWLIDKYGDSELTETIHSKADRELYSILSGYKDYQDYDSVVLISLILIQIKCYDGSFYPHLEDYYEDTFKLSFSDSRLQHIIRHMIKDTFDINDSDQRVITHLLIQALVPIKYVSHFYEFVFDIYKYNYDYMLPSDDDNNISYEDIKNDLVKLFRFLFFMESEKEDDSYEITINNQYKIYKLIVSSKMALSNEDYLEEIIPIVINIMKILDRDFWGNSVERYLMNEYYRYGFLEWKRTHYDDEDDKSAKKSNKKDKVDNFRDRIVRFDINSRELIFRTRSYQIVDFKEGSKIRIEVYNGDVHVKTVENLSVREALGVVRVDPQLITTTDFLGQLNYKVFYNDSEIHNSGSRLYQDVFLFDKKGDYLRNFSDYEDNALILSTDSLENENIQLLDSGKYFLYAAYINKGFRLIFGKNIIVSTKIYNDQILGEEVKWINCYNTGGNKIEIFTSITNLVTRINIDEFDSSLVFLNINGQNTKLELSNLQFTTNEDNNYLLVNWESLKLPSNYYEIDIIYGSKSKMSSFKFIYDDNASYKEIFEHGDVLRELNSSFFLKYSDRIDNHQLHYGRLFNLEKKFKLNNEEVTYISKFKLPYYIIDGRKYSINKIVWFDDIESKLVLNLRGIVGVTIITEKGTLYQYRGKDGPSDSFTLNRGDLGKYNNHENDSIKIRIKSNQYKSFTIKVLFRNLINFSKTGVVEVNDQTSFKVEFEGYNTMNLEVYDGYHVRERIILDKSKTVPLNVLKDRKYTLKLTEGSDDIFARTPIKMVYTETFVNVSLTTILNSRLRIMSAQLYDDEADVPVYNAFIGDLQIVGSQLSGNLYFVLGSHQVYFDALNPVQIEILDQLIHDGKEKNFMIHVFIVDRDEDGIMVCEHTNRIKDIGDHPYGLEFEALVQRR